MKAGYQIAQKLKTLDFEPEHQRTQRAMFVAQSVGYHVPLAHDHTAEETVSHFMATFKRVLNDVNEIVPVDTRLAVFLFERIIHGRVELLQGLGDPTLIANALTSQTQESRFSPELAQVAKALVSNGEFSRAQYAVSGALTELFAED